jgi:hypothetical protein
LGEESVKLIAPARALGIVLIFVGGFLSHVLYQRWNPPAPQHGAERPVENADEGAPAGQSHPVLFAPLSPAAQSVAERPFLQARDVEKIRALTGRQARIRGRVFRVGHSARSDTYFLNFGPSRGALTAVIFASALEQFEKQQLSPKDLQGKDVEISGEIKDHPQYGLEMILDNPQQIKVID